MAKRIAVIIGHPDPRPGRFCRALAEAYAEGARRGGHEVVEGKASAREMALENAEAGRQGTVTSANALKSVNNASLTRNGRRK